MAADRGDLAFQQAHIRQLAPVHRKNSQPQLHLHLRRAAIAIPGELVAGLRPWRVGVVPAMTEGAGGGKPQEPLKNGRNPISTGVP
jgi:hypothetical protein